MSEGQPVTGEPTDTVQLKCDGHVQWVGEPTPDAISVVDGSVPRLLTDVAVDPALRRLARLVAAGILRTRNTPDGMIVERVPKSRAAKAKRIEQKRKRHLKRRSRK